MKRQDLYETVTNKIIAQLEEGKLPWVRPWNNAGANPLAIPRNAKTGNRYSGINVFILWDAGESFGQFKWLTYKQAKAMGGNVRKGESGVRIYYADKFIPKAEKAKAAETGDDAKPVWFLKGYTVFNIEQCDGLPDSLFEGPAGPLPEKEAVPIAEDLIKATGADFRIGGNSAYYVPSADFIQVPPQESFKDQINYYRTCFHELGHWTGHKSRLDRGLDKGDGFGSKVYAKEELVAEMATAFVCASLGIVPTVRHADYIGSWLEVLNNDNRFVFKAASLASKAADYLLAFAESEEEKEAA